jgi:cytochrome c oxidase assembly factor 4
VSIASIIAELKNLLQTTQPSANDEEDPFEKRLEETGCAKLHYALQDCMDQKKDWRQCQPEVRQAFASPR